MTLEYKDSKRKEELLERLDKFSSKFDIYAPPPQGVKCDCNESMENEHFHLRPMAGICDVCSHEEELGDIIAYTKKSAYDKLAIVAETKGWLATPNCDYMVCPNCVSEGFDLLNR